MRMMTKKYATDATNCESLARVQMPNERNESEPNALKDMDADSTSSCQSSQSETQESQENGLAEKSKQRECSLSSSSSGSSSSSSSSDGSQSEFSSPVRQTLPSSRSPSPPKSDEIQNATGSSGFVSRCPGEDSSCPEESSCSKRRVEALVRHQSPKEVVAETKEATDKTDEQVPGANQQWRKSYEWLNAWLSLKGKTLGVFDPISSESHMMVAQEVRVLRDEFSTQLPRIRYLVNVLAELPSDSADAQKLNEIKQRWLNQLAWLEKIARKLSDPSLILQDIEILVWLTKFSRWLSEAENKLQSLQPATLNDIVKQLKELSVLYDEVLEKSLEFERNQNLGETFIDADDDDKDGVVKKELTAMKNRWSKLNDDLLQRTQLLGDIGKSFTVFNKCLSHLNDKLELCENELTSYHALGEADKVSNHPDSIKKLQEETVSLQKSLDILERRTTDLVLKSREQKVDVSHLLNEVNRVGTRFSSWKVTLLDRCNKMLEQQLSLDKELQQAESYVNTLRERIEKTKVSVDEINQLSENVTVLMSGIKRVVDLGFATDAQACENDSEETLNAVSSDSDSSGDGISLNNEKAESSRKTGEKRQRTASNSEDSDLRTQSRTSSKFSEAQNKSVSELSLPTLKKSKHSKDLGDCDSVVDIQPQEIKKERDETDDFNAERCRWSNEGEDNKDQLRQLLLEMTAISAYPHADDIDRISDVIKKEEDI